MKKTPKEILHIARIFVILLLLYAALDLFNVPSRIGVPIENVNWDAAGVLCGNLVVITLFTITYHALDKRSVQKEHNRRKVALYMLRCSLMACIMQIEFLKKPHIIEAVLKKIDFTQTNEDDPHYRKLLSMPFSDHNSIVSFASEGVISEEEFSNYDAVKAAYCMLVTCLITFHSVDEMKNAAEERFIEAMKKAEESINRDLRND